jgi:hypothetical protein
MKSMSSYLAGLLFGDGTSHLAKNGAYAVWIDQHERNNEMIERAVRELKKMNLNVHHYGFLNKKRAMVYSKALFQEFRKMRESPAEFFNNLSEKKKFGFISGFFDAEGTATDRLVVYNGDLKILEEIKKFLTKNSIFGHIYKYGKVYGIQIYRRDSIRKLKKKTNSIKIKSFVLPS